MIERIYSTCDKIVKVISKILSCSITKRVSFAKLNPNFRLRLILLIGLFEIYENEIS